MKICFIQKQAFPYFGIMALSAVLKQRNDKTDVLINANEKDLVKSLKEIGADIVGFSVLSSEHKWLKDTVRAIKKETSIPIIAGGVHPRAYPEEVSQIEGIDDICSGEGGGVFY